MDKLKKNFASKLLKIKAIKLQPNNPFTWASGWKSPFYCDNRKTLSYPDLRNYVKFEIVHTILEEFPEGLGALIQLQGHKEGLVAVDLNAHLLCLDKLGDVRIRAENGSLERVSAVHLGRDLDVGLGVVVRNIQVPVIERPVLARVKLYREPD